ncbi:MAG: hypothetical protein DMG76_30190 [Acidobacteria bacterium]|nr:MAG: hypothetical protein DMG76_30190 [Acidobacteriota bacterium]
MDRNITRRDFLNGMAMGAGGVLVHPWLGRLLAAQTPTPSEQDRPGYYPPTLNGMRGSHPGAFEVAHALRDGTFWGKAGKPVETGILRHPMSHGLQVDFSYTYSKSIDLGSDTERVNSQGTTSTTSAIPLGTSTVLSYIANPWNPGLNRAPSDFDLRHVVTFNWVYELPFGRGKAFAGGAGNVLDALIGGWLATLRSESLEQCVSV